MRVVVEPSYVVVVSQAGTGARVAGPASRASELEGGSRPRVLSAGRRLRRLELGQTRMGVSGAKALAAALGVVGAVPALVVLRVESNGLGNEGARALAGGLGGRQLQTLCVGRNGIDAEGVAALRAFVEVRARLIAKDPQALHDWKANPAAARLASIASMGQAMLANRGYGRKQCMPLCPEQDRRFLA